MTKVRLMNRDDAVAVAQLMKAAGAAKPAAVKVTFRDVPDYEEWWAVASPTDLDTIRGHVEELTMF